VAPTGKKGKWSAEVTAHSDSLVKPDNKESASEKTEPAVRREIMIVNKC
jgi:hypothetical protein